MTIEIVIAALALPLLAWFIWSKSDRAILEGRAATALGPSVYVGPTGRNAFISLSLGNADMLLAEIPLSRVEELKRTIATEVRVWQSKRFGQRARITQILWPTGPKELRVQAGEKSFHGLALTAYYLLAGMFLLASPFTWAAAAALVISGFLCGNVTLSSSALSQAKLHGAQYLSFGFLGVMCAVGTYVLFSSGTPLLMVFPGICLAFAAGQLFGMLTPRLS